MSEYLVKINWTKYCDPAGPSKHLNKKGVLYLFGTNDMSLFVGIADDKTTVEDRIKTHMQEKAGPVQWIEEHKHEMWYPWDVKVGGLDIEKYDEKLLRNIVSLLVEKEQKRGGCIAQREPGWKRTSPYLPGLKLNNVGDCYPLLKEYFEDTEFVTQEMQPYVLPDDI